MPFEEWAPISLRRGRRGNFVATFLTGRKWEKFKLPRPARPPAPERSEGEEKERVRASKLERHSERPERGLASRYKGAHGRPLREPGPKRVAILTKRGTSRKTQEMAKMHS